MMANTELKQVVLYQHGIGCFVRQAAVTDDQTLQLPCRTVDLSDILKSLTVVDFHGGTIREISYDSSRRTEELLNQFPFHVSRTNAIKELLPQLQGTRILVMQAGMPSVDGILLGVDQSQVLSGENKVNVTEISLLTDDGLLHLYDLQSCEICITDAGLKEKLQQYLGLLEAARSKDTARISIFASGRGDRKLQISYQMAAPTWKATYRVLLHPVNPPLLQGWGIVDNTFDENWDNIQLTLVSGLPITFTHDLVTPRYIERPDIPVENSTGIKPPVLEQGFDRQSVVGKARKMARVILAGPGAASQMDELTAELTAESSVEVNVENQQSGDLFEYQIVDPVTIPKHQSALVPILKQSFDGESVLFYQKNASNKHPMRCVRLHNTTGFDLEGGPITIYREGQYAGEAMLPRMKKNDSRLVAYAVELGITITDQLGSTKDKIQQIRVRHGVIHVTTINTSLVNYTMRCQADAEQKMILEHPKPGKKWKLSDPAAAFEETENAWRFQLTTPALGDFSFSVQCYQPVVQQYQIAKLDEKQIWSWLGTNVCDEDTTSKLKAVFKLRSEIATFNLEKKQIEAEKESIVAQQQCLRENLKVVGEKASENVLRQRYISTLMTQEDRLLEIAQQTIAFDAKIADQNQRLENLMNDLSFFHTTN
ncbi:MAG: hypothetical protein R3B84_05290 [Zavarzinella sp.]